MPIRVLTRCICMKRPNILVLMNDQHRADCLSCAGHPAVHTPNMDRLAAEGVRFSRAYTASPVCMPARSSLLTGLYCHNHGQWSNGAAALYYESETYPNYLKRVGYHTCHIGKGHLYPHGAVHHLEDGKPVMRSLGWDDVFETTGPSATRVIDSIVTDHWRQIGCLETFRADYRRRREVGRTASLWPSPMPKGEALDDFIGRTAVDYLSSYDREEPFLVFVGFAGPHPPWDPPADWAAKYDPAKMDGAKPVTEPGPWVPPPAAEHQRELQNTSRRVTPEVNARIRSLYYAKISHIDSWFGRILDTLEDRGMLDNTAVIFWSDHGEMLCDKGRFGKSVFYEEAVHVPLIIRPIQSDRPGRVCDKLVSMVDVFATILDLAGCETGWRGLGKSLLPLLEDPEAPHHDAVFSEIQNRTMIRNERFKMVVDNTGTVLKLYDLEEDPDEAVNLVGRRGTEETVSRLNRRLLEWYLSTPVRRTGKTR